MNYGLQLFSVKDCFEPDMEKRFSQIKDIGYSYVEFAGFYNYEPEQIKECLCKNSLGVIASHVQLADLCSNADKIIA